MECIAHREIRETANTVRDLSYTEKKGFSFCYEERINELLDAKNDFKSVLYQKTVTVNDINLKLERLTWFTDLDENCLMLMNDLIALAKDLYSTLRRQFVSFNTIDVHKYANHEIEEFKNSLDDLKETYTDLDSVFFYLPKMNEFIDISKKLSSIK